LPAKLLAIREFLNVGQADMASKLQFEILFHSRRQYQIEPARVWQFEKGKREPNLFVLIAYVRLGHLHMESVVDDGVIIDQFRTRLGKEFHYPTLSRPTETNSNKRVIVSKRIAQGSPARLGDYVRRTRTEKGLSLLDVSERCAHYGRPIAASYINRIERNPKLRPTPDRLRALAVGLGVPVDELLARAVRVMHPDEANELSLLARFRELSPQRKADLWNIMELWRPRDASKETPRSQPRRKTLVRNESDDKHP
jgi:transcriptional regulator with XRE-family HTH domain